MFCEVIMICSVTGNRPKGFIFARERQESKFRIYLDRLNLELDRLISTGYTHFITGLADGADIDFAVCVCEKMKKDKNLILEAALPYPRNKYSNREIIEYGMSFYELLDRCTKVTEVSDHYYRGCLHVRNRYMVDSADHLLAIWNGCQAGGTWYTLNYALKKNKNVGYILLNEI